MAGDFGASEIATPTIRRTQHDLAAAQSLEIVRHRRSQLPKLARQSRNTEQVLLACPRGTYGRIKEVGPTAPSDGTMKSLGEKTRIQHVTKTKHLPLASLLLTSAWLASVEGGTTLLAELLSEIRTSRKMQQRAAAQMTDSRREASCRHCFHHKELDHGGKQHRQIFPLVGRFNLGRLARS